MSGLAYPALNRAEGIPPRWGKEGPSLISYDLESCQHLCTVIEPQRRGVLFNMNCLRYQVAWPILWKYKQHHWLLPFPYVCAALGARMWERMEKHLVFPTWDKEEQQCHLKFEWSGKEVMGEQLFIYLFIPSAVTECLSYARHHNRSEGKTHTVLVHMEPTF